MSRHTLLRLRDPPDTIAANAASPGQVMDDDEPTLLHEPDLMLAILRAAHDAPAGLDEALTRLRTTLAQAHEPAPTDPADLALRLRRAAFLLLQAGALAPGGDGRFRLTARGRELVAAHPDGVDQSVLAAYPEFRAFLAEAGRRRDEDDPREAAFDAGVQAFLDGRPHTDNPHPFDTADHLAWECGWFEARDAAKRP